METQHEIIKLPVSGQIVTFKPYLTTGQSRELQKILLSKGSFNTEAGKLEGVSTETYLDMQDKAAGYLIQSIKSTNGAESTFTPDWLYNLPVQDGNLVYEKINEITQSTNLSKEAKKN